jgi:hypothetical protein
MLSTSTDFDPWCYQPSLYLWQCVGRQILQLALRSVKNGMQVLCREQLQNIVIMKKQTQT